MNISVMCFPIHHSQTALLPNTHHSSTAANITSPISRHTDGIVTAILNMMREYEYKDTGICVYRTDLRTNSDYFFILW